MVMTGVTIWDTFKIVKQFKYVHHLKYDPNSDTCFTCDSEHQTNACTVLPLLKQQS